MSHDPKRIKEMSLEHLKNSLRSLERNGTDVFGLPKQADYFETKGEPR